MRRFVLVVAGCALSVGCAQVLSLQPWKDPPGGAGGSGGSTSSTSSTTTSSTTSTSHASSGAGPDDAGNATCADGVKNGLETDVDCGGDACPPCGLGKHCGYDGDCQSGGCGDSVCVVPDGGPTCVLGLDPTCIDCVRNGLETDVDCGGDDCFPCGAGKGCKSDADCISGSCVALTCSAGAPGEACHGAADCASQQCAAGSCWTGSCCQ